MAGDVVTAGLPASPQGTALDGGRVAAPAPWRVAVPWARVVLGCDWPSPASALRGAVVGALGGVDAHIDFHSHLSDGTTRQQSPPVLYRVRDRRPEVFLYGPRAHEHALSVARIDHLLDPARGGVPVDGVEIVSGSTEVGVCKDGWRRYELASNYFPSGVACARRPKEASHEQDAWAAGALGSSLRLWLEAQGITPPPHRPVVVHLVGVDHERVTWRDRREAMRWGFRARFVSNAIVPDGIGLGQHVSEGWGEVWRA